MSRAIELMERLSPGYLSFEQQLEHELEKVKNIKNIEFKMDHGNGYYRYLYSLDGVRLASETFLDTKDYYITITESGMRQIYSR